MKCALKAERNGIPRWKAYNWRPCKGKVRRRRGAFFLREQFFWVCDRHAKTIRKFQREAGLR